MQTQRYLRIKRRDKTYCLLCNETQSIASIKKQLTAMIRQFQQQASTNDDDDDNNKDKQSADDIPNMRLLRVIPNRESKTPEQLLEAEEEAILEDGETLASAKITDNQVLHLVFCINEEEDEYEPVEVISTDLPLHSQQ